MPPDSDEDLPFRVLRRTWQPVALARDVPADQPHACRLLGVDLVVARTRAGWAAWPDRCPHRGARLARGRLIGDELECPYHGWRFARDGRCTAIPSLREPGAVPAGVRIGAHAAVERYGMVWVCLDGPPIADIPAIPEFTDPAWSYVLAEPMDFAAGFRREVENYLDMSHFAIAHRDTLGAAAMAFIDRYQLTDLDDGLRMDADFPALPSGSATSTLQAAHRREQRCWLPNVTTIRQLFPGHGQRLLVHVPSPRDRERCRVFWALAISPDFVGPSPAAQLAFAVRVLDEDRQMCESQRPAEVPFAGEDGFAVPADRFAAAWRRRFRAFCLAADDDVAKRSPETPACASSSSSC